MDEFTCDTVSFLTNVLVSLAAAEKTASKDMKPILREAAFAALKQMRDLLGQGSSAKLYVIDGGKE